jgi:hypothetical protein
MDSHLARLQAAIASATRGMTSADLTHHSNGKWSAAEVLEHLYLTYTRTVKGFERCLAAGKPLATSSTLKQRINTLVVVSGGHMPGGRKASAQTSPQGLPAEKVMAEIGAQVAAMDAIIAQCESRYGRRIKLVDHPVLGPLTGRQWCKFHWVHGRHHVKQIVRLREGTP